jgi:hypothetical protein
MMPSQSLPWCVLNLGMQCFKCSTVTICTGCFSASLEVQKQKSPLSKYTPYITLLTHACDLMCVCVCVCMSTYTRVSVDMAPYEHTKKSQLTVTNQTIVLTFSSPNDLDKSYNMADGHRITVCHPKYNTWMLMKHELLLNEI